MPKDKKLALSALREEKDKQQSAKKALQIELANAQAQVAGVQAQITAVENNISNLNDAITAVQAAP